jgi:hypothetical protein
VLPDNLAHNRQANAAAVRFVGDTPFKDRHRFRNAVSAIGNVQT